MEERRPVLCKSGMTMIELSIVMGMVSLLLALILALSRHVNAISNIRRAQIELGAWHEALQQWFLQFGEYPCSWIDNKGEAHSLMESGSQAANNLSNLVQRAYVQMAVTGGSGTTNVTFQSFLPTGTNIKDPWGMPYIYQCDEGRRAYTLFSCGPDRTSTMLGGNTQSSLDDIHFER